MALKGLEAFIYYATRLLTLESSRTVKRSRFNKMAADKEFKKEPFISKNSKLSELFH